VRVAGQLQCFGVPALGIGGHRQCAE
jgi:hypothetical protein